MRLYINIIDKARVLPNFCHIFSLSLKSAMMIKCQGNNLLQVLGLQEGSKAIVITR